MNPAVRMRELTAFPEFTFSVVDLTLGGIPTFACGRVEWSDDRTRFRVRTADGDGEWASLHCAPDGIGFVAHSIGEPMIELRRFYMVNPRALAALRMRLFDEME
jgi:hypothetical protein